MTAPKHFAFALLLTAGFLLPASAQWFRVKPNTKPPPKLSIGRDAETRKVVVRWTGQGVLKRYSAEEGRFKTVRKRGRRPATHEVNPTEEQMLFRLQAAGGVYSVNVVGYANLMVPPGLSLIANPLYYTNNSLSLWLPTAPDGAQVFKYADGGGYEVSTFDANTGAWSNPDLQVPLGTGFYVHNPSQETLLYTFVGEVLQGTLINPLPAGISVKGALVPQAGSINSVHNIPGEPGDEIRIYVNDGQGGGSYSSSIFSADDNAWVPDLQLQVGQGFWIQKQNPEDWVRFFSVN